MQTRCQMFASQIQNYKYPKGTLGKFAEFATQFLKTSKQKSLIVGSGEHKPSKLTNIPYSVARFHQLLLAAHRKNTSQEVILGEKPLFGLWSFLAALMEKVYQGTLSKKKYYINIKLFTGQTQSSINNCFYTYSKV